MAVFVLDKHKKPLMPCTERRARLFLERGPARIHKTRPFIDRTAEETVRQPLALKIEPGSKTTGIGFQTGDTVRAILATGKYAGTHTGRVAIRTSARFNVQTANGTTQAIAARHCTLLHRANVRIRPIPKNPTFLLPDLKDGVSRKEIL